VKSADFETQKEKKMETQDKKIVKIVVSSFPMKIETEDCVFLISLEDSEQKNSPDSLIPEFHIVFWDDERTKIRNTWFLDSQGRFQGVAESF